MVSFVAIGFGLLLAAILVFQILSQYGEMSSIFSNSIRTTTQNDLPNMSQRINDISSETSVKFVDAPGALAVLKDTKIVDSMIVYLDNFTSCDAISLQQLYPNKNQSFVIWSSWRQNETEYEWESLRRKKKEVEHRHEFVYAFNLCITAHVNVTKQSLDIVDFHEPFKMKEAMRKKYVEIDYDSPLFPGNEKVLSALHVTKFAGYRLSAAVQELVYRVNPGCDQSKSVCCYVNK